MKWIRFTPALWTCILIPRYAKTQSSPHRLPWIWHALCFCCSAEEDWHGARLWSSEMTGEWREFIACAWLLSFSSPACSMLQLSQWFLAWLGEGPQQPWTLLANPLQSKAALPHAETCKFAPLGWSGAGTPYGNDQKDVSSMTGWEKDLPCLAEELEVAQKTRLSLCLIGVFYRVILCFSVKGEPWKTHRVSRDSISSLFYKVNLTLSCRNPQEE